MQIMNSSMGQTLLRCFDIDKIRGDAALKKLSARVDGDVLNMWRYR